MLVGKVRCIIKFVFSYNNFSRPYGNNHYATSSYMNHLSREMNLNRQNTSERYIKTSSRTVHVVYLFCLGYRSDGGRDFTTLVMDLTKY